MAALNEFFLDQDLRLGFFFLTEKEPVQMDVHILELVRPRTLSCCMVVNMNNADQPIFLKLYDRRFADQLRNNFGAEPWTQEIEASYTNAVESGAAAKFLHDLDTIPDFQYNTQDDWNSWQTEVYLSHESDKMYEAEIQAYDRLADLQGKQVPRLLARVNLTLSTHNAPNVPPIKGILLQYIDGFPLSRIHKHAPRSAWQNIVDQAVEAVRTTNDRDIINEDVRLSNFMVERTKRGQYKVYMFDFGLSRVRTTETDREWATEKIELDEDGAVGLMMKKILAEQADGFELQYEDSKRYWADAGCDEDEGSENKNN